MALRVDVGLMTLQHHPDEPAGFDELYDDAVRHAEFAEQCGFDGVWASEHHLSPDGYLPSPLTLLSAIAARTRTIELGTNIAIAPLYHPRRLAEDGAVIAAIGHRRVLLGLGIGYRTAELEAFGVARGDRASHIEHCAEFCRTAWVAPIQDPVYGGIPTPSVPPEIWLGGLAPAALKRAGRLASGYIATSASVEALRERLAVVDTSAADAGRPGPPGVVSNHLVSVSADGQLRASVGRGIAHMMRTYQDYAAADSDQVIGDHLAERAALDPRGLAAWGDPNAVVAGLRPFVDAFAGEREHHLMVRLHHPGMSRQEADDHVRLFATDVMPRLRAAAR
jgi:alkanesulfonate monooxygenase SsuD/methylene tetrahydromethanopterin reductase-like flavin-dependent oxidoreductase (luciferase family)